MYVSLENLESIAFNAEGESIEDDELTPEEIRSKDHYYFLIDSIERGNNIYGWPSLTDLVIKQLGYQSLFRYIKAFIYFNEGYHALKELAGDLKMLEYNKDQIIEKVLQEYKKNQIFL